MEIFGIATVAFMIAGFVKGVVGFGFPIIALIILTLSIGLLDALALVVIPTLITNLWQVYSGEYLQTILKRMWRYFLVAVVFIWISTDYLNVVDTDWLTMLLGTVLFFFALSHLFNFHFTVPQRYESVLAIPVGAVNGILTGLTGSFMVPSVLYMQAIGLRGDMLVQAMGVFFSISVFTLAVSLVRNDLISVEQAQLSSLALIPSFIGLLVGRWTRWQIDEDRFQQIFLIAVLVLGGYIVFRSGRALGYMWSL
jgi:uncharacterized membrane protein YfcA